MRDRNSQFLALYQKYRCEDQRGFYEGRQKEFGVAHRQAVTGIGVLMVLTTLFAALASASAASKVGGPQELWVILGVVLPALSTALAAYSEAYAFERQSKLYDDAANALFAAAAETPELPPEPEQPSPAAVIPQETIAAYVAKIEGILQKEQGQWGQLVSEIKPIEAPAAPKQ